MKRREDVIRGLKCCIVRKDDRTHCPECPYRDPETYCLNRLMIDALETLEAVTACDAGDEDVAPACEDYCEIEEDAHE